MSAPATHRSLKAVPTASAEHNRSRRTRMTEELRRDARAKLVSAKRARPIPHALPESPLTIEQCVSALSQPEQALAALQTLRHLLGQQPPTPEVIPALTSIIALDSTDAAIAEEALWCLNVLAHGFDALVLVDGVAPILLHRLVNQLPGMKAAAWTVANLAADNPGTRHRLRELGALDIMLTVLQNAKSVEMARIAAWALCNLVRGHNPPEELRSIVESRLPKVLVDLARSAIANGRIQVLAELLWVCTYLTAGDSRHSSFLLDIGLGQILYDTLCLKPNEENERSVKDSRLAALRCIGNVVSGPDELCEALLEQEGFVKRLGESLNDENPALIKEAMWAISNICGGAPSHAVAVVNADLVPKIVTLFRQGTFDIKKECGFALYNLARVQPYFERIWNCQILDEFLNLMRVQDGEAAELGFKFVKLALNSVPGNGAVQALRDNDGQQVLEDLRLVREDLQREANQLIDQYLDPLDEDEDLADAEPAEKLTEAEYPPWRLGAHRHPQ